MVRLFLFEPSGDLPKHMPQADARRLLATADGAMAKAPPRPVATARPPATLRRAALAMALLVTVSWAVPREAGAGTYSDVVVATSGLTGYWRLSDPPLPGSSIVIPAKDEKGDHDGYYVGPPRPHPSLISHDSNRAVHFDDNSVNVPAWSGLHSSAFSAEAWVKWHGRVPQRTTPEQGVLHTSTLARGHALIVSASDQWTLLAGNGSQFVRTSGPTAHVGEIVHLVGTYDGQAARLYVNGQLAGSRAQSYVPNLDYYGFGIGKSYDHGWTKFFGAIDEVALYNRALSPQEVNQHYVLGAGIDSKEPQLSVSGPVRDAADDWVHDGTHDVVVDARDGSDAAPESGVRRVELIVDDEVVDSVELPCLSGNCRVRHTFRLDTGTLRYGAHDLAVRAIDQAGNTAVDSWMVATEPVRTVFEFEPAASLDEVHAAAVINRADIMDFTHYEPGVGGYVTGDQAPSEAVAGYRESYQEEHGVSTDPHADVVTFGGAIPTEALGPLAAKVSKREAIDLSEVVGDDPPELEESTLDYPDDLLAADIAAEDEPLDPRDDPDATVSASVRKFSPAYGKMWTWENPPIDRNVFYHRLTWKRGSLEAFERDNNLDYAYEHDVKLYDDGYSGTRKHPFCKGDRWWSKRRLIGWNSNFPKDAKPWWDENVGDSCRVLDFTFGIKFPLELQERKRYDVRIVVEDGARSSSRYQLRGARMRRVCPGEPRICVVGASGNEHNQLLIGKSKGTAPECRRWRKGRRSRKCP